MRVRKSLVALAMLLLVLSCKKEEAAIDTAITAKDETAVEVRTEVEVTISGLASFADLDKPADGGLTPIRLYLMNARKKHHPHIPVLMYLKSQAPSLLGQSPRPATTLGVSEYIELAGEELVFIGATDKLDYDDSAVSCATPDSLSLQWIPRLRDVTPDHPGGPIGQTHFSKKFITETPSPDRVAAYVNLKHGKLEATVDASPIVWAFKDSPQGKASVTQRATQMVMWKFSIPGEFLTIASRQFSPVGSVQAPLLRLKAVGGKIKVTLGNVVQDDLKVLQDPNLKQKAEEEDPHYAYYYDFLEQAPNVKRVPFAYGICHKGVLKVGDTDEVRCMMAEFIKFKKPPTCLVSAVVPAVPAEERPPVLTIGGLNCIPDRFP